ncbi:hypothetical protein CEE45_15495 [Candidatus Heimdallarchaeota archaeon B3_Heim]|nr:MAG: hypothetical protein CEE45_15495 [Candidatus Heimdallarchaeota archaeon B3_Heim]
MYTNIFSLERALQLSLLDDFPKYEKRRAKSMMNLKRDYLGILIAIILCMGILIPFNPLVIGTDHPTLSTDSSQISNAGEPSQQTSNEVSSIESTTVDFSWLRWYLEYDNDSDGAIDTIEIFYEFSDFTTSEWVDFEIEIQILFWNQEWQYIDSNWEWFTEYVEPSKTYIWSYMWRAWYDGNYSFSINVYDYSIGQLAIEDIVNWNDASKFAYLNDWERWIEEYDEDGDSLNDTIEIWYSLNFSFSDWVNIQIRIEIFYWNGYWEHIDTDGEYFGEDVTAGEVYNVSYKWRAWYNGNYNFSIRIQSYSTNNPFLEEWVAWSDASSFSFFSQYNRTVDKYDEDGDMWEDTISIEYSINFSFTDWAGLEIWIDIYFWNGYWEHIDTEWEYFWEDVTSGEVYNISFQWTAWYDGDYNFSIRIRDEYSGIPLIEEWVAWNNARAFTLLDSWDGWFEDYDEDGDGCKDTIELGYNFKFRYTGQVEVSIHVEIRYWNAEYGYWDWSDSIYEWLDMEVTAGDLHTWSMKWYARDSGMYEFSVHIQEERLDIPIINEVYEWTASCAYNPVKEWGSWYEKSDKDGDGYDDTVEIGFDMLFTVTGELTLYLRAEIRYWDENSQDWNYIDNYYDEFVGDIIVDKWYYCSFEWSAWQAGDYEFFITITGENGGTYIEDTIEWDSVNAFELLDSWNSWYTEYDEDNDGCMDTIEIGYDFRFTVSGWVDLDLSAEINYWDEESGYWEWVNYVNDRFYEEVTAGEWYTFSFRWSASDNGDFEFQIFIRGSNTYRNFIEETIVWQDACKFMLIKDWNIWYNEYDEDTDGLYDTIEIGLDLTFSKSGPTFLIGLLRIQYWNEQDQYWQEIDIYMYEFFDEDVTVDVWYTMSFTWSALYSGNYNISFALAYLSGATTNIQIEEWVAWTDVSAYQGLEFEWNRIHEEYYEKRPDSITLGYNFLFSESGFVDFDIRITVLYADQTAMTFNLESITWDSFTTDVMQDIWYEWSINWDLVDSDDYMVYFFITIFDGRARLIDDLVGLYLDEYAQDLHKLLPVESSSTTTTKEKPSSTTTTTTQTITPGWTVTVALTMLLVIIPLRRLKRRIG